MYIHTFFLFQGAKGLIQSPLLDYFDCKGENPYKVTEIVEGEIWQVGYKMENTMYTRPEAKKMMKLFGFGWPNEAYNTKVRVSKFVADNNDFLTQ